MIASHLITNIQTLADLKRAVDVLCASAKIAGVRLETVLLEDGETYDAGVSTGRLSDGSKTASAYVSKRD